MGGSITGNMKDSLFRIEQRFTAEYQVAPKIRAKTSSTKSTGYYRGIEGRVVRLKGSKIAVHLSSS